MFKRAVISGEGGTRKWVCAGLQVFRGVCHVYFFLLGGKLPMILLVYSSACLKSFITNEVGTEGEPGLLFAGDGEWGWREMSQERRTHGFSPPSTVWSNTLSGKWECLWDSTRWECREQDSRNSLASLRIWVSDLQWALSLPGPFSELRFFPIVPKSSCLWLRKSSLKAL